MSCEYLTLVINYQQQQKTKLTKLIHTKTALDPLRIHTCIMRGSRKSHNKFVHTFLIIFIIVEQHWKCSCASIKMSLPPGAIAGPRILRKPDPPVLYYGDDVSEFLSMCPNGCDKTCELIELESNYCSTEDQKVVKDLKNAQKMVRDFQNALKNFTIDMIQWTWYGIILLMGLYLIIVKHFHFKTLLDSHHPDATDGMDLWQYERLKYVPVEVQQDQQSQDTTSTHIQQEQEDEQTIQTEEEDDGDEKTLEKTINNTVNDNVNNDDNQMSSKKDNSEVLHDSLSRKVSESNEPLLSRKDEIKKQIQLNNEAKTLQREHRKKPKSLSKKNKKQNNVKRLKKNKSDNKSVPNTKKANQLQEQQPSVSNSKPISKEEKKELEATILYPKHFLNPNEDDT